jgi:hypothetical protein
VRHESLSEFQKWGGRTCWPMFHAVNNNNSSNAVMHQSDHFPVVERLRMHVLSCLLGPPSSHVSDASVVLNCRLNQAVPRCGLLSSARCWPVATCLQVPG